MEITAGNPIIPGFKGFDKDLKCRGHQYVLDGVTKEDSVRACGRGFHMCTSPMEVINWYRPAMGSRYAKVDGGGKTDKDARDSKIACAVLHVGKEIGVAGLVRAGVEYARNNVLVGARADFSSANAILVGSSARSQVLEQHACAVSVHSGEQGVANTEGHRATAVASGKSALATSKGTLSIAATTREFNVSAAYGAGSIAATTGEASAAISEGRASVAASTGSNAVAITSGDHSVAVCLADNNLAIVEGGFSTAIVNGEASVVTAEGVQSIAVAAGRHSAATVNGEQSIAMAIAHNAKAQGAIGCWLVLTEWKNTASAATLNEVKVVQVDGTKIKAHTFYQLIGGKVVLAK